MDEIEFEPADSGICECCGATTTRLTRYVYRDGVRFAIYLAVFSDGHPHVDLLFSLGPWGDGTTSAMRTAFPVRYMMLESGVSLMLVHKDWSPWDTDFFGRMLDREEALEHPLKQEIFDLSDHIWSCDQPIVDFLLARSQPS